MVSMRIFIGRLTDIFESDSRCILLVGHHRLGLLQVDIRAIQRISLNLTLRKVDRAINLLNGEAQID